MRIRPLLTLVAAFLLTFLVGAAAAADPAAHPNLEKGLEAARRSGRPLFVVTLWPPGV